MVTPTPETFCRRWKPNMAKERREQPAPNEATEAEIMNGLRPLDAYSDLPNSLKCPRRVDDVGSCVSLGVVIAVRRDDALEELQQSAGEDTQ